MKATLGFLLLGLVAGTSSVPLTSGTGLSAMALTVHNDALIDFIAGIKPIARAVAKALNEPRCPEPYFPVNDECFYINYSKLDWFKAKTACEQMDGHLAEPENVFLLYHYLRQKLGPDVVWFFIAGLRAQASEPLNFVSGRQVKASEWAPNNPHNNEGENCLVIKVEYPPLADYYCSRPHESICEYGPDQQKTN